MQFFIEFILHPTENILNILIESQINWINYLANSCIIPIHRILTITKKREHIIWSAYIISSACFYEILDHRASTYSSFLEIPDWAGNLVLTLVYMMLALSSPRPCFNIPLFCIPQNTRQADLFGQRGQKSQDVGHNSTTLIKSRRGFNQMATILIFLFFLLWPSDSPVRQRLNRASCCFCK